MIGLVEGAERRKTPNEIALNILLAALTLIFVIVVATLRPFGLFAGTTISETTLIALLVALIPTTIGALLSAIGIAGIDRLVRRNVLALSGRAVEASGDVDVLLLDKTGTITIGNRLASEFIPMPGVRRVRARRSGAAVFARRRDARGALDRRACQAVRHPRARHGLDPGRVHPVHGADAHERGRLRRPAAAQGRRRLDHRDGGPRRRLAAAGAPAGARPHRQRRRHAARRRAQQPGARRHLPQGHDQGGHEGPLRPAARDGHQNRDGHGRQQAHRGEDRRRVGRRRLPRRSHPGAQARADPRGAVRGAARRDDRRRHQRRARRSPRPTSAWR